jgi:D-alanine-D-alanine ligase-like ATP-grasp enzyme
MILIALVIGGLSLWQSGFWLNEVNTVPNFTAMAMVFLVISQGMMLKAGLKKGKE